MLKILRKKGVMRKLLWVLAGTIILSFGILSQAYLLRDRNQLSHAGKIFGKKISLQKFQYNFRQTNIQAIMQHGENFAKVREFLNLESQTWDRIILLHEANRRRIKIPDKDVVERIQSFPFFQRDGQFDNELYNTVLRYGFKITPRDFEEGVRDSLKFSALSTQETVDVSIPEQEIINAYKLKKEKVQVDYIVFPADKHMDKVEFDEAQAKEYFLEHKEDFRLPPMVNVEYIQINYPEDAQEADKEKVTDLIFEISQKVEGSTTLHEVGQKHNIPVETSGFFSMEQPNLEIGLSFPALHKIFYMEVGQISDVIETPNGFQFVKLLEKKDAMLPEYVDVTDKVKEAWTKNEAKKLAQQKAQEYSSIIRKDFEGKKLPDFAEIAKTHELQINQTAAFSRGQYLPNIGISKDFQDAAFSLTKENSLSDIVEIQNGYCILHLASLVPMDEAAFEKEKEEFEKSFLAERKNAVFSDFLSRLRLEANLEDYLSELTEKQQQ